MSELKEFLVYLLYSVKINIFIEVCEPSEKSRASSFGREGSFNKIKKIGKSICHRPNFFRKANQEADIDPQDPFYMSNSKRILG